MRLTPAVATALLAFACGPAPKPLGAKAADFSLLDVNPASPRAGQQVSPGDYLGRVSGWYFTHTT